MSKRITFTDFEVEQLIKGLEHMCKETSLGYEVVNVGKRFYAQLIKKLKNQHPRSVEILNVSGNGDANSVAQKGKS